MFCQEVRSANGLADALAKQEFTRVFPWEVYFPNLMWMVRREVNRIPWVSMGFCIMKKGRFFDCLLKMWGLRNSNEAEVLVILEALRIFSWLFQGSLIVKSDTFNAISWVYLGKTEPWKLQFSFNEIKALASNFDVFFHAKLDWLMS